MSVKSSSSSSSSISSGVLPFGLLRRGPVAAVALARVLWLPAARWRRCRSRRAHPAPSRGVTLVGRRSLLLCHRRSLLTPLLSFTHCPFLPCARTQCRPQVSANYANAVAGKVNDLVA